MRAAEAVHIIGQKTERNIYITRNAKKIICIPNGVDLRDAPESEATCSDTIGALCRLTCHQKGLDLLIPAFAEYKRRGGKYILKIAGKGEDEPLLREMIRREKMENSIFLVGPVFGQDKWKFLHDCIAHISPSRFEGIPMSCLEAAYMRCVQLTDESTNLGSFVNEYKAGLVLEEPTVGGITKQLQEFDALSETTVADMREGAHAMIVQELNWANITRRFVRELYGYTGELPEL